MVKDTSYNNKENINSLVNPELKLSKQSNEIPKKSLDRNDLEGKILLCSKCKDYYFSNEIALNENLCKICKYPIISAKKEIIYNSASNKNAPLGRSKSIQGLHY